MTPVKVGPFAIERYYERCEFTTELMLSSSDCESRTIAELLSLEPERASACSRCARLHRGARIARAARGDRWPGTSASQAEEVRRRWRRPRRASSSPTTRCSARATTRWSRRPATARPSSSPAAPARARAGGSAGTGRLGARPRRAGSAAAAETRLIYVNLPHNPTGTRWRGRRSTPGRARRSARSCCSATRSIAASSTTRPSPARRRDTTGRALSLGTRVQERTGPAPAHRLARLRDPATLERIRDLEPLHDDLFHTPSELLSRSHCVRAVSCSPATMRSSHGIWMSWTVSSAAMRRCSSGCARSQPRSGSPSSTGQATSTSSVSVSPLASYSPGSVYDEPDHVRLGFGRANLPEALAVLEGALTTMRPG